MKKILILTSLYSDDFEKIVKQLNDNFSKDGLVLDAKMLNTKIEKDNNMVRLLGSYKAAEKLIELGIESKPEANYILYVGPCGRNVSFDTIIGFKGIALDTQEFYLKTNYPKIKNIIEKEIYNSKDISMDFPLSVMLIEKIREEIEKDGFKQVQ